MPVITLPEGTADAIQKLNELLVDPPAAIYLFIFGDSNAINTFATAADGVTAGALRRVVRRSKCSDLMTRFKQLAIDPDAGDLESPDLVAFSTSGHLVIADVILSTDALTAVRATNSFIMAEGE